MPNKQGYITLASSTNKEQLIEASLLARSIKIYDQERETCLITDSYNELPQHIETNFDYVIELPYGTLTEEDFKLNIWQIYYCSPFEENMYLDSRCLLLNSIDGIWENLSKTNICFPSYTVNFKNEPADFLYYFKCHEKNNFLKYHTDIFYFKKTDEVAEFFKMLDPVLQNWRSAYLNLIKENRPEFLNINILFNITIDLVGLNVPPNDYFKYTFLSLENVDLDDHDLPEDWTRYLSCWVRDKTVKVNNHRLVDLVYYNSPTFIDSDVLNDFGISS